MSSRAFTLTAPPALTVPVSEAELAVSFLAKDTAAPKPTKPPAPAMARLWMEVVPPCNSRVPASMLTPPALVKLPALMLALLAPPSVVKATPALKPKPPMAKEPALFKTSVLSRLLTATEPAVTELALKVAEVECAPDAPA